MANHFPNGRGPNGKNVFIRDSEAKKRPRSNGVKRKAEEQLAPKTLHGVDDGLASLVQKCPRLRALRERVCARLAAQAAGVS